MINRHVLHDVLRWRSRKNDCCDPEVMPGHEKWGQDKNGN